MACAVTLQMTIEFLPSFLVGSFTQPRSSDTSSSTPKLRRFSSNTEKVQESAAKSVANAVAPQLALKDAEDEEPNQAVDIPTFLMCES